MHRQILENLLKSVLSRAGASVIEAGSWEEGLRTFGTSYVDLVICDLQMPGMNGHQVLEAVRVLEQKEGGIVPVIAVTPFESLEDYAESREALSTFSWLNPLIRTN